MAAKFGQIKGVMSNRLNSEAKARKLSTTNTAASYQGNGTVTTLSGGTIKARLNTSAAIGIGETVQIDARAGSSETFIRTQPR